jgi:hypothetical protein
VVVPSNDLEAFTAALERELAAENNLNVRARQRILEHYTVTHLGDRTEEALLAYSKGRSAVPSDTLPQMRRAGEAPATRDSSIS